MNSDSLNMVSRLGEGHMPGTFFLSEPQLKTTVRDIQPQETQSSIFDGNLAALKQGCVFNRTQSSTSLTRSKSPVQTRKAEC